MKQYGIIVAVLSILSACAPQVREQTTRNPSLDYANRVRGMQAPQATLVGAGMVQGNIAQGARAHAQNALFRAQGNPEVKYVGNDVNPLGDVAPIGGDDITVVPSQRPLSRDYLGPLSLGDPGVSASLWREGRDLALVRDYRAFQPYDLITVSISEKSEGSKEADTDIKQDSSFEATISKLLGLESYLPRISKELDPSKPLIAAELKSEFKSEGETTRKGKLTAKISAMVMEVLPSGILRIEGEKIISVNNEDEVMVISGLVRPEDVSSSNEVDSSKVANVRVDYFGKGSVGSAQSGGWLGNIIRSLWPL